MHGQNHIKFALTRICLVETNQMYNKSM